MAAEHKDRVGRRIKKAREDRRWSQRELAERLPGKVDGPSVSRWERGITYPEQYLSHLAHAFEVDVSYFLVEEAKLGTANLMDVLGSDPPHEEDRVERLLREILTRLEALEQLQDQLDQLSTDARATWLELAANDMEVLRRLDDIAPPKQDRPPQAPR